MQTSRRPRRLAFQIQREVSIILTQCVKDRRIGLVTVTGVEMSPDLRHAGIYVTVMGTEKEKKDSLEVLNHASGWIRRELGLRIRIKFLPEIVFRTDNSQDYGDRIDRLLGEIQGNEP